MSCVKLSLEDVVAKIRESPFYLAKRHYIPSLSFIQSATRGDFCIHADDLDSPVIFDVVGEVDRDLSFCSPAGSYNPEREHARFRTEDITDAKIRIVIRDFSNPRFQRLVDNDWNHCMDNMESINRRAFSKDIKTLPTDRIHPARAGKLYLQHALVVPLPPKSKAKAEEVSEDTTESHEDASAQPSDDASNSGETIDCPNEESNSDDLMPALEPIDEGPSPYSFEGWPVDPNGPWRAELNSVSDTHTVSPLVAYLQPIVGEPVPIPPNKYSSFLPGAAVHIRFSLLNHTFGTSKATMVAKIEELTVLQRAPVVPDSPMRKRFSVMTTDDQAGPSKRTRSKLVL